VQFHRAKTGSWAWPAQVIAAAYLVIGGALLLQPTRFESTPAYANLIDIANQKVWGAAYVLCAVLLAVYVLMVSNRFYGILAHTVTIIVTVIWLFAFIVRWWTDAGTTVVNIVSWAVFLFLAIRSGTLVDESLMAQGTTTIEATLTIEHDDPTP